MFEAMLEWFIGLIPRGKDPRHIAMWKEATVASRFRAEKGMA
jgi:hypothetical protein